MQSADFLTVAECAEVDQALMTSQDKFAARVAIYALRSLKLIAEQQQMAIHDLNPEQIEDWVYQDQSLEGDIDRDFRSFFAQMVVSSRKPLQQAAANADVAIEDLTVSHVVKWFEQAAKVRLQQNQ
ncbi:MAG TPA: hypothetical protein IGS53_06555 [Leptolyngbyaceae cyanobacterium M33_DOE_097]|uniref:Uncharacterized protein n=1 Tax=Oscillatoriales cyanobacterium SpSt-418 TaxID=2282169 RepID=A0A7C3PSJ4_9CYAN|nr:hypothetical protein [Leptolyngbyaceae cyanobacterium M33_DOE_097]